jgi:hypothetical protein
MNLSPPKLLPRQADAFNLLRPAALVLVAAEGPLTLTIGLPDGEQRRIGHNRPVWPARLATSGAWRDTVTPSYDKSPVHALTVRWRVWCLREPDRDRLAAAVQDLIAARAEADGGADRLRGGFSDLGPDLDLGLFELEVFDVAKRLGVMAFDDAGLAAFLGKVLRQVDALRAAGRGPRSLDRAIEAAADRVLGG